LFLTGQTFEFSQEVARTWKVEAMPTFVLVKDGKEVGRVIGAKKDELERKIRMFVTSSSSS
jgi:thioredoxin 1